MCPAGRSYSTVVMYFRTGVCSLHEKIFSWAYSLWDVINKLLSRYEPACRTVLSREGVACWRRHSAHRQWSPSVSLSDVTSMWMFLFFSMLNEARKSFPNTNSNCWKLTSSACAHIAVSCSYNTRYLQWTLCFEFHPAHALRLLSRWCSWEHSHTLVSK